MMNKNTITMLLAAGISLTTCSGFANTLTLKTSQEKSSVAVACKDASNPSAPFKNGLPIQPTQPLNIPYTLIHALFGSEQITCKFSETSSNAPVGQATIALKNDKTAEITSYKAFSPFSVVITPAAATSSYVSNITVTMKKG